MLEPYRVLDLTDERGQLCGQILADLGADVILVEPPDGSPARRRGPFKDDKDDPNGSLAFWSMNRNKRGITLDLEREEGRARFRDLVRTADFVIESFAPGYLKGLGLGYDDLAAINRRLVMVSITPFGQEGPKATWAANDLTVWNAAVFPTLVGDEDRAPVRITPPQAFLHAGAEGAVGALIAHLGRERDGVGQHVDVSAQAASAMATQSIILQHGWADNPVTRVSGGVKFGPLEIKLIYPCKDGYVTVLFLFGSGIGPFTRRLMELMYEEGFVDEATRDKDWINYTVMLLTGQEPVSELQRGIAAIEQFTRSHTKAELFDLSLRRGLLIVPVSTPEDAVNYEQLHARDYWTAVPHPELGASITYPGPFAKFSTQPIQYRRRPPLIGEHTAEVLADLGGSRQPAVGSQVEAASRLPAAGSRPPLDGIKVLDFTWVIVGPHAVRYLADYGATVIKIDSTSRIDTARTLGPYKDAQPGPERSGLYANVNAGKLGMTLNLAKPEGRAIAMRLVKWADVVVENYSPKAMRAWGMDYESLRAVNPGIIMMSTCLGGQTGPHAQLAGFGTMGGALGGFAEMHGWPDRAPAGAGAYTDYVAPKFIAAAILASLDHRRRTGEGQYIDLAQSEASMHFLGPALLDYTVNGRVQTRAGNSDPYEAPHGVYPAAGDDRWAAIACATDAQWQSLCRATGHPEWLNDPRFATLADRVANREALDALIAQWTRDKDVGVIEETLQAAGVPVHRSSSSADAFADPQLAFRGHFVTVEHAELGPVPVEGSRMRFSRTPARITKAGPTFGRDNEHVLRDILGMGDDEIVELIANGVLE